MDLHLDKFIGFSPQFSVYTMDDRQLLLLSEQRSFRLSGRLYVALAPYLDGKKTINNIIVAFEDRVPVERMTSVLKEMYAKSYITYLDISAPITRQAMWVELDLPPLETEQRLSNYSLAVIAASDDHAVIEATDNLKYSLKKTGFNLTSEEESDLIIVTVEDYLRSDLAKINLHMREMGYSWIPFKAGGSMPLFGPIFRSNGAPCWSCLRSQILENRPGDTVVGTIASAVRPARAFTNASLNLAIGFASIELSRALATEAPTILENNILGFDLNKRLFEQHLIRIMPHCEICGVNKDAQDALETGSKPLILNADKVQPNPDGGWRTLTAAQVVEKLSKYVSPITGIISGIEDRSPANGLPVFTARQTNPVEIGPRQNRIIGRPSGAAGKGMSEIQAKASCLAEAMERYLSGFTGHEPRLRAIWGEVKESAPHPYTYLNFSEQQYDTRDEWNKKNDAFNWVAERFNENLAIEWTPSWSLTHGALRWLPTRACYFGYFDPEYREGEENIFCRGDSNGCASGTTLEEAIVQGFFELVERDACALWWYNRIRRPAFKLEDIDDPFIRRTQTHCMNRNLELAVLDVTNDLGLPVAIAMAYRKSDGKSIYFGLGSHFDVEIAISRALAELNQIFTLEMTEIPNDIKQRDAAKDSSMLNWLNNHSVETDPYCLPEGTVSVRKYKRPLINDLNQAVNSCIEAVSDRGYEMIVLNLSRPEIDFASARVVVPGLRHFWARFREGRLYDVPVELGWLSHPTRETDLNPVPFFL